MIGEYNKRLKFTIRTIVLIGLILLLILNFSGVVNIVRNVYGVFFPLLFGAAIAYVLNILMSGYEKIYFPKSHNRLVIMTRRGVSIFAALLTIALVLLLFLIIIIPQAAESIRLLTEGFPAMYNNVVEWAKQYSDEFPVLQEKLSEFNANESDFLNKGFQLLGNGAWVTVSLMGSVFGKIMNFILAAIFAIYILFGKEDLKAKFDKLINTYMKAKKREKLYDVLRVTDETFSGYIVGQCKEAVILGVLCTIGMLIFRFPYSTIIGPVVGLTALIPLFGAYIGAAVGFLLIVMVAPFKALLFIVFIIVLQQIEGNLIYPKVVGGSIGLPGIWVFAAVTVGGGLMGITGVLLGVPIAATVYKLLGKSVNERIKQQASDK